MVWEFRVLNGRESGWRGGGRVVPCFRPDAVFRIASPGWPAELEALGREHGAPLTDYAESDETAVDWLERLMSAFR